VRLNQRVQPQAVRDLNVPGQGRRVQQGTDQQDSRRAQAFRFINLIGIDREILAQDRNVHRLRNLFQISVAAEKIVRLCQHGDGRRAGIFVLTGDLEIREVHRNDAFRGRGFFDLADKCHVRTPKGLLEREAGIGRQRLRFGLDDLQRLFLLQTGNPLTRPGSDLIQDHDFTSLESATNRFS